MNNPLQSFTYGDNPVRTTIMDGEAWFALADVGTILEMSNPRMFLRSKQCDPDGVKNVYSIDTTGRNQEIVFISKPNVYAMALRSNKDEAIRFQRWLTRDVIPSIEKQGAYIAPGADQGSLFQGAMALVAQMSKLENRVERIESTISDAKKEVLDLPSPLGEFPEMSQSRFIERLVRLYCTLSGCRINAVYPKIYEQVDLHYGIRLSARAKKAHYKSILKYAIDYGHGQKIYAALFHMLQRAVDDRAA